MASGEHRPILRTNTPVVPPDEKLDYCSFIGALVDKYLADGDDDNAVQKKGDVFIKIDIGKRKWKDEAKLGFLHNVILSNRKISHAGLPEQGLRHLCPNVVDLDISFNVITSWREVAILLENLKKLKYISLAGNILGTDTEFLQGRSLPALENLVLNKTKVCWETVADVCKYLPTVFELHVCGNGYKTVCEESVKNLFNVECLRMNNNQLKSWVEVAKLGRLPNLKSFIISDNPLQDIFYNPEPSSDKCFRGDFIDVSSHTDVVDRNLRSGSVENLTGTTSELVLIMLLELMDAVIEKDKWGDHHSDESPLMIALAEADAESQTNVPSKKDVASDIAPSFETDVTNKIIASSGTDMADESAASSESDVTSKIAALSGTDVTSDIAVSSGTDVTSKIAASSGTGTSGTLASSRTGVAGTPASSRTGVADKLASPRTGMSGNLASSGTGVAGKVASSGTCVASKLASSGTGMAGKLASSGRGVAGKPASSRTGVAGKIASSGTGVAGKPASSRTGVAGKLASSRTGVAGKLASSRTGVVGKLASSRTGVVGKLASSRTGVVGKLASSRTGVVGKLASSRTGVAGKPASFGTDVTGKLASSGTGMAGKLASPRTGVAGKLASPRKCVAGKLASSGTGVAGKLAASFGTDVTRKIASSSGTDVTSKVAASSGTGMASKLAASSGIDVAVEIAVSSSTDLTGKISASSRTDLCDKIAAPAGTDLTMDINAPVGRYVKSEIASSSGAALREETAEAVTTPINAMSDSLTWTPFAMLETLCLSNTEIASLDDLQALSQFPKLRSLRIRNKKILPELPQEDRRKIIIACLPNVYILNGSEVSDSERNKSENHFLQYFKSSPNPSPRFAELVEKHGYPPKIAEIDLGAGFCESADVSLFHQNEPVHEFTAHVVHPVSKLRRYIAKVLNVPHNSFRMYHYACGPYHLDDDEIRFDELIMDAMPLSRYNVLPGDEIHIELCDAP